MRNTKIAEKVIEVILEYLPTFDRSEISPDNNIEEDLLLDIGRDIPAIIAKYGKKYGIFFDRQAISDFVEEALEDSENFTLGHLIDFIEDEEELN